MDITLIVKASNQQLDDQTIQCEPSWTIRRLKGHLTEVYPGKPSTDEQKLIYSGQLLSDSVVLKDVLRHYDGQKAHTVHLVFTPKNNRHRDFNSGGTSAGSGNSRETTMSPKANNESGGATTNAASSGTRVEPTRSPESATNGSFGADGLRQRNVTGGQQINTAPAPPMATDPIPPASADYIMGQHLAMQNWMQQAYMQYLNQYMNVISNGQNPQALYASAPTNPANPIIPQSSPQTNVAQAAQQQPIQNPVLAQTLPNLAYYPYLSTMSSSPMPSASSIPAPISSSGTIPAASPSPAAGVAPGPSSQPTIASPVHPSPATSAVAGPPSPSSVPGTTATVAVAAAAAAQQDTAAAQAAAPAAAPAAAGAAAAAPARRFPNIVVEEQENRDWLDIFFSMCRVGILMTVVYLYSSPTRCLTVFLVGIMLYLYHIGFFRNNRADRMERARRLVVQQINMAHIVRQNMELRARAGVPAPAAGAEANAANAQAPSPAAAATPSTPTAAAQTDATDGAAKTVEASSSSSSDAGVDSPAPNAVVEEDIAATTTESNAAEEMALLDSSNPAPEANRVTINDAAAFLRTLVLSFFTSIIPDTPAA